MTRPFSGTKLSQLTVQETITDTDRLIFVSPNNTSGRAIAFDDLKTAIDLDDPAVLANQVIVTKPSDFSGTIDPNKQYFLDGIIDMTGSGINIEIPAGGMAIAGYDFDRSQLICSDDNYTLFTSPGGGSGNVLFMDIALETSGTNSQVYNIVSNTGFDAMEVNRVNYNNCTSLGTMDNYRQGLEIGTGRFGGSPELTLKGTWVGGFFIDTSIVRSLSASFSGSLFKAGAAFTMASRFRSNQNIDLPALASFFDFAAANFPNPSTIQIEGAQMTRDGVQDATDSNLTPNIGASELPCAWIDNKGLDNTFEGGRAVITGETATALNAVGIGVFLDLDGTWTASDLQHFDSPSNGQLRHLGIDPREYRLVASLSIEGTANDIAGIKIVKWDDSAAGFVDIATHSRIINPFSGPRDVAFFTIIEPVTLDQNDYIKLQVNNQTAARDVTAEIDASFIIEER